MIVIDTSFAIKLLKQEVSIEIIENEKLIAPLLFDFEITNVLWKLKNFTNYSIDDLHNFISAIEELEIERIHLNMQDILDIACETGLTSYDSAYLLLAKLNDCVLATFDKELAKVAKKSGISTIANF